MTREQWTLCVCMFAGSTTVAFLISWVVPNG